MSAARSTAGSVFRVRARVRIVLEIFAFHELHRDVVGLVDLAQVEDLDDVRVRQRGHHLGLFDEHLDELLVARQVREDPLDGDHLLEAFDPLALGAEDLGHPAGRDLLQEGVAAVVRAVLGRPLRVRQLLEPLDVPVEVGVLEKGRVRGIEEVVALPARHGLRGSRGEGVGSRGLEVGRARRAFSGSAGLGPEIVDDVAEEVVGGEEIPAFLGSPPDLLFDDGRVDPENVAIGSAVPERLSVVPFGHILGRPRARSRESDNNMPNSAVRARVR